MVKKKSDLPDEILRRYEELVAAFPDIPRKGAVNPYTSMNGNMFSFLTKEGQLAVRLGKDERLAFEKRHGDSTCIQHGAVMRDYVLVPDALFGNKRQAKALFAKSIAFATTLKAKPTTKKKVAAKTSATGKVAKKKATKKKPSR